MLLRYIPDKSTQKEKNSTITSAFVSKLCVPRTFHQGSHLFSLEVKCRPLNHHLQGMMTGASERFIEKSTWVFAAINCYDIHKWL